MNYCSVCGAPWREAGPHCCGHVGPRIGDEAPRCVLRHGHEGDHRPDPSWSPTRTMSWTASTQTRCDRGPLGPLVAARKAHLDASPSVASMKWERFIAEAVKLADAALEKEG
jgi:hypothetical protein